MHTATTLVLAAAIAVVNAQSTIGGASCSPTLTASYPTPSVADGFVARLVANNLSSPRGLAFDSRGNLLVVEQKKGITALTFTDAGAGCLSVASRKTVIDDSSLNHGITFSRDGATLYASNPDDLYSWAYDPAQRSNTSAPSTLVSGMATDDHTTRTLLLSQFSQGMMIVTRGSTSNLDYEAASLSSGHSQIKAFNISALNATSGPYDFNSEGILLGWGLRNDVGIDEEPKTGAIYSVENSADQITRNGVDIHENNPGEELNFLGYLNMTMAESTTPAPNYGYPYCFAAWNTSIPDFNGTVGDQFVIGDVNSTNNDGNCSNTRDPRLTFQAHMAPLDILFNTEGTAAWITFHGSWDRTDPSGYKLSYVEFNDGSPVDPSNSTTALRDVLANSDNSKCPDSCFRPVGLAWDSSGRLFMSSDSTGEIYAILQADGSSTQNVGTNSTSATGSSTPSPSQSSGALPACHHHHQHVSTAVLAGIGLIPLLM